MRFDKSFESLGFWITIQFVFSLFFVAGWTISAAHLKLEQEWSSELLNQNTHSVKVISSQNKYIQTLEDITRGKRLPIKVETKIIEEL